MDLHVTTLPAERVQRDFYAVMDDVVATPGAVTAITVDGRERAALMSWQTLQALVDRCDELQRAISAATARS